MDTAKKRMMELIEVLDEAAKVYYQGKDEIMSNYEYDALYDELCRLEEETGITLSGSPTSKVGYEVASELPKETHNYPVLSLDKTKDTDTLASWLNTRNGVLSWKLDGLTVVVTYEDGKLTKAVTRGNGTVGEVITANARTFAHMPLSVPYKGRFVLRGEAIILYSDFEKINEKIENPDDKYKNPRNLCSGSVRQLDSSITAERNVHFIAYSILDCPETFELKSQQMEWIRSLGFEVVGYDIVDKDSIKDVVAKYSEAVKTNDFPSDGLVLSFDDIAYGESLGRTAKFPRHSIAFKWADEIAETTLLDIEWSASRTGLINPVAIFEPVELEGTTVSRASVHNVSIVKQLKLGIGDRIQVYKANMIIPQIAKNLTESGILVIAKTCPVCGCDTVINNDNGTETLVCPNDNCLAKQIKSFVHFTSRDAMNVDGLSEATLEKFIAEGILKNRLDLYTLEQYKDVITQLEGFGEKSYTKLIEAIEKSKEVKLENVIYSLGINGIGLSNAKVLCKYFAYDCEKMMNADYDDLINIDGMGDVLSKEWVSYMSDNDNRAFLTKLLEIIKVIIPDLSDADVSLQGLTVVITGSLTLFDNRKELKNAIEDKGGKVTGSVTSNTDYLINNDVLSNSSKNKKAKELNVTIISEQDFYDRFLK